MGWRIPFSPSRSSEKQDAHHVAYQYSHLIAQDWIIRIAGILAQLLLKHFQALPNQSLPDRRINSVAGKQTRTALIQGGASQTDSSLEVVDSELHLELRVLFPER